MLISEMLKYGQKMCIFCLVLKIACPSPVLCVCVCVRAYWQEGISVDRVHTQVTSPCRGPSVPVGIVALQAPQAPR